MQRWRLVVVALLLLANLARAQGEGGAESGAPAGYREAIGAAIEEYEAGSYYEAREQFRRAHVLFPNARTLRGLGFAEYELHNYVDAMAYLEQALASEVRPLEAGLREQTEQLLARTRAYVGKVDVQVEPRSARITVDGQPVERQRGRPLSMAVGDHIIEASAAGHLAERRALKVEGGGTHVVRFQLPKVSDLTPTAEARGLPESEREGPKPVYKRWWLWTSMAALAGGAVVAAVLLTRDDSASPGGARTGNMPVGAKPLYPVVEVR